MKFKNPEVSMSLEDQKKIEDGLEALRIDPHAPRKVTVDFILHVHNEFPKHVTVGKDKDGNAITKIANSEAEEEAFVAEAAEVPAAD